MDDLSAEERVIIEKTLGVNPKSLEDVAVLLKLPVNRVFNLFISAHNKYVVKNDDERITNVARKISKV